MRRGKLSGIMDRRDQALQSLGHGRSATLPSVHHRPGTAAATSGTSRNGSRPSTAGSTSIEHHFSAGTCSSVRMRALSMGSDHRDERRFALRTASSREHPRAGLHLRSHPDLALRPATAAPDELPPALARKELSYRTSCTQQLTTMVEHRTRSFDRTLQFISPLPNRSTSATICDCALRRPFGAWVRTPQLPEHLADVCRHIPAAVTHQRVEWEAATQAGRCCSEWHASNLVPTRAVRRRL